MHMYTMFISIAIVLISITGLLSKGLTKGIDFAGGILIDISVESDANESIISDSLRSQLEAKYPDSGYSVQNSSSGRKSSIIIKIQPKDKNYGGDLASSLKSTISQTINGIDQNAEITFDKMDYIGPKAEKEFISSSIKAMIIALIGIMLYVWARFEWYFGIGVILSLIHDAIATIGFYVFSGYEFDLTAVAAILTVIGYSVNDSVVIYDRIRHNMKISSSKSISDIIDISLNETLSRTLMTVITTLAVCLTLGAFGGPSLEALGFATFFGITVGTYSSIFVSIIAPLYLSKKKV